MYKKIFVTTFRKNILLKKQLIIAGLEGFEPTTAGLRVLCATWLRHRPTKNGMPRVVINLKFGK